MCMLVVVDENYTEGSLKKDAVELKGVGNNTRKVLDCSKRMHRTIWRGRVEGQLAKPGLLGKWLLKWHVCRLCSFDIQQSQLFGCQLLVLLLWVFFCFLRASALLKHVIDIGWTSVCLSVCLSVTRWHPIKTAEYIVMLSSPHNSPFILVLCISRCSRNSDGVTPCGGD